ncbi:hypothetical protein [Pontibacter fetidus]|uniref:Uncharacterized protein n=1 Tax=Pontibacter fetidus TaxID=2700082 RepID=A0A6B2H347_9BACT|nr:hypothetical protein [Pontibacter fetidus]NDK55046.1 hypothetical protein [Pontibacter fetidus]
MEYNIKFINGDRLLAIGLAGMILSMSLPIYLKINFNIKEALMIGLIPSMLVISCITAYFASKRNEYFLVNEDGLHTSKHGLVKWSEVHSLDLEDRLEAEVLTIRLRHNEKIVIPSRKEESPNRQTFVAFREDIEKRFSEEPNTEVGAIQESYAYGGKGYRMLGYTLLLTLCLLTPYVLYVLVIGDMTAKKFVSVIVVYSVTLPMLGRIFREEIFGKTK